MKLAENGKEEARKTKASLGIGRNLSRDRGERGIFEQRISEMMVGSDEFARRGEGLAVHDRQESRWHGFCLCFSHWRQAKSQAKRGVSNPIWQRTNKKVPHNVVGGMSGASMEGQAEHVCG